MIKSNWSVTTYVEVRNIHLNLLQEHLTQNGEESSET